MHSAPKVLAVARDYDELVAAFRARRDELKVPHLAIDDVAGLQTGYTGKLLADPPIRAFGRVSLGPMLGTLGLAVIVVADNAALRRVQHRLVTRKNRPMRADRHASWFSSETGREMARRRAEKMSAKARSMSASKAARARWHKPRLVAVHRRRDPYGT